ncbi:MAG: hypothetical protein K2J39_12390 [Ruminococcus sp.]|nr:hypothetical protein [Ruminococcus sp.]
MILIASKEKLELNTGLSDEQVSEAFRRALNDMTDEQINLKFSEILAKITDLETKISALEKEQGKWIEL